MSNMIVTLDFPEYMDPALLWAQKVYEGMQAAKRFLDRVYWFGNRDAFDLRKDDKTLTSHPCHQILLYGTKEEMDKGLVYLSEEYVRNYSLCGVRRPDMFYMPTPHVTHHTMTVTNSPYLPAWMVIVKQLNIQKCSHIFVTDFTGSETAMMFFPFSWGEQKDMYLLFTFGRTSDDFFLFQGDPGAFVSEYKRMPRSSELETMESFDSWNPPSVPNVLPIDILRWESGKPVYDTLREFDITEYREALVRLESLGYWNRR